MSEKEGGVIAYMHGFPKHFLNRPSSAFMFETNMSNAYGRTFKRADTCYDCGSKYGDIVVLMTAGYPSSAVNCFWFHSMFWKQDILLSFYILY
jgi:hypothetical protein